MGMAIRLGWNGRGRNIHRGGGGGGGDDDLDVYHEDGRDRDDRPEHREPPRCDVTTATARHAFHDDDATFATSTTMTSFAEIHRPGVVVVVVVAVEDANVAAIAFLFPPPTRTDISIVPLYSRVVVDINGRQSRAIVLDVIVVVDGRCSYSSATVIAIPIALASH